MKTLLVEDHARTRQLLKTILEKIMGYDVIEAANGEEAWEKLPTHQADLLLVDWNMPVMNGLELVQKIRRTPEYDDLPVGLLTVRTGKEDVMEAVQAGVDAYISKPFSPQQLKEKIHTLLATRTQKQTHRMQKQISRILEQRDTQAWNESHPLVLFGEEATTGAQLRQPEHRESLHFLGHAISRLKAVNAQFEERHIGYLLENSTGSVAQRLLKARGRIRMLLLSASLPGGGITLARLAKANRDWKGPKTILLCDDLNQIDAKVRYSLEQLGISIYERPRLRGEALAQLFQEYLVASLRDDEGPGELPSPEEIRQRLETDIRTMVTLPVLPQVGQQILVLNRDPQSDLQDWIDAIDVDPLTRAQVIRRARSPLYGFRGEISDTNRAVVLLGKNAVAEIVISGAVKRSFATVQEESFDVEDFWQHSVAVGFMARLLVFPLDESAWTPQQRQDFEMFALSEEAVEALQRLELSTRLSLAPEQDPFLGGMMHDIGKVALVQSYPGLFPLIIEVLEKQRWNLPMRAAEDQVAGGVDHSLVGGILAESWDLGSAMCQVIEKHHAPSSEDRFSQLVALADFLGGGIYPYPRQASFPLVRGLRTEVGGSPSSAPAEAGEAETGEAPSTAPAGAGEAERVDVSTLAPLEAMSSFLPEGLLASLDVPLEELIALERLLAPTVRRLVEQLRESI